MRNDFEIKQGHALEVLQSMDADSVQCAITSPPYYGLRSYKTEPQIWDGNEFCDHVWHKEVTARPNQSGGKTVLQSGNVGSFAVDYTNRSTTSDICQLCNAWRGELGLEPRFQDYIRHLTQIFAEVKRVLKSDGTCFVNLGDSFNGAKASNTVHTSTSTLHANSDKYIANLQSMNIGKLLQPDVPRKSLMNIPHRFFIAMTDELQMIQRNNINWWKRACMPSSATDRWTVDFESIGFFSKNPKYKFNQILEPYDKPLDRWGGEKLIANGEGDWDKGTGQEMYRDRDMRPNPEGRNPRTTWDVAFEPSGDEHYASYPTKLVEKMILAGTDEGDTVLDIFAGTGTTLLTALRHRRHALGIELQPKYVEILNRRLSEVQVKLF